MTVARTTTRRKAQAQTADASPAPVLNELNAPRPAPLEQSTFPTAADASPDVPSSPSASPADDPFAGIAPGGPTLFEAMDGPRPRRWLIAADGIGVSAAWDAWRVANPTGTADAFVALIGRALGDAPDAVTSLSVVRVRL